MLHCSKVSKIDAKFAALKSHVTCEVTILGNKVDSFLLVSHITSKSLQQLTPVKF